jgi:aldehyde dehydrogenase
VEGDVLTPGQPGSPASVQDRYGNYIGGEFVPPAKGEFFENISPVTGLPFTEIARSGEPGESGRRRTDDR